jgi:hypothetical protein
VSDAPTDYQDRLNLREQIGRIDRARIEGEKLAEETRKFVSEQHKLMAEARKLDRDRWLAPLVVLASVMSGAVVAIISHLWR